jgi:hypothetical protein
MVVILCLREGKFLNSCAEAIGRSATGEQAAHLQQFDLADESHDGSLLPLASGPMRLNGDDVAANLGGGFGLEIVSLKCGFHTILSNDEG